MLTRFFSYYYLVVLWWLIFTNLFIPKAMGQDVPVYDMSVPLPTFSGIPYGEHERNILDFWKAESDSPTPLVFVVHGGGWTGGEKERVHRFVDVQQLLDAGISVAAINYRLMKHIKGTGIMPPVKVPMYDAARALQFLRTKALEWNIDKQSIAAAGGSAGACTSLWLAYHDDLADPDSKDTVARESTRLCCVAVMGPQTSLDPKQMKEWIPNSRYGGHAFGISNFEQFLAHRETILPWIKEYSPFALVSADDPPVYLYYNRPPAVGEEQKDPTHSANFGVQLKERCDVAGIKCEVQYPNAPGIQYENTTDYLISTKKGESVSSQLNTKRKRPNVLFIAIDDLRPELGCYGAKHIKSPNIDKLAREGVLFNRVYCQAPHCAPSRSSLLSGVSTMEYEGIAFTPEDLAPGKTTLPAAFRNAGYHTINNGKIYHQRVDGKDGWSEEPFSLVNGPEDNNHITFHDKASANYILEKNQRGPFYEAPDVPDNAYIDGQTCDKTIQDLKRLAKMGKPFFLACGFVRPHLPFYAPKKYWDLYDREKIALADNRYKPINAPDALSGSGEFGSYHDRGIQYNSDEFHKIARHGYYACVSYADALVGNILATLDELDLRKNTIVVLWGDHGWNLGEHDFWSKHNLLYTSKNAPLIISAPGYEKDAKTDGIAELLDVYPTLIELAGLQPPKHLEGKSLVPLLKNPDAAGKKAAYTKWRNGESITTERYTYTEWDKGQRMLFDLLNDPDENVNIADDPAYEDIVKQLKQMLKPEKTKTIGLIGDSTVGDMYGWGPAFSKRFTEKAAIFNFAKNGATLSSLSGNLDELLVLKPDYVLIQFGHNDQKRYDTLVYSEFLRSYVDRIQKAGGKPIIISSVTRRTFNHRGEIVPQLVRNEKYTFKADLTAYATAARNTAKELNVPFIDLNTLSIQHHNSIGPNESKMYNYTPDDKTHFSEKGAQAIAGLIINEIGQVVPELYEYIK